MKKILFGNRNFLSFKNNSTILGCSSSCFHYFPSSVLIRLKKKENLKRIFTLRSQSFSSLPPMNIFDNHIKSIQRQRLSQQLNEVERKEYNYLREEVAKRLTDRIEDITQDFPHALEVGCLDDEILNNLGSEEGLSGDGGGIGGVKYLSQYCEVLPLSYLNNSDSYSSSKLNTNATPSPSSSLHSTSDDDNDQSEKDDDEEKTDQRISINLNDLYIKEESKSFQIGPDKPTINLQRTYKKSLQLQLNNLSREETQELSNYIPFPYDDNSFDMVISNLSMHWINDLPFFYSEVLRVLKPNGVFLGSMFAGGGGNETLKELRISMQLAELERKGGISPHVSPTAQVSDGGSLLQGSGFSIPTIDVDTITVMYPSALHLMEHLQKMGESSALLSRPEISSDGSSISSTKNVSREVFVATAAIYQSLYGEEDGSVPATFQIMYMIGWKPHDSQQKPLKRGSAQKSMKEVLAKK